MIIIYHHFTHHYCSSELTPPLLSVSFPQRQKKRANINKWTVKTTMFPINPAASCLHSLRINMLEVLFFPSAILSFPSSVPSQPFSSSARHLARPVSSKMSSTESTTSSWWQWTNTVTHGAVSLPIHTRVEAVHGCLTATVWNAIGRGEQRWTDLSSPGGAAGSCAGPAWWGGPGPAAGTGSPDGRGGGGPAPTPGTRWHWTRPRLRAWPSGRGAVRWGRGGADPRWRTSYRQGHLPDWSKVGGTATCCWQRRYDVRGAHVFIVILRHTYRDKFFFFKARDVPIPFFTSRNWFRSLFVFLNYYYLMLMSALHQE